MGCAAVGVTHPGYGADTGPEDAQHSCPAVQHDSPQQEPPAEHAPPSAHGIGLQPPSQYVPCGHWVSHAPQWSGLLNGLTQAPAQQRRPVPQPAPHPPPPELPELLPLVEPLLDALPPELPPLELPDAPPPEDEEAPPLLPEPLELVELPLDEDEEAPVSAPVPSVEASTDPPELNVEPPHAAPMTPTAKSTEDNESPWFIE